MPVGANTCDSFCIGIKQVMHHGKEYLGGFSNPADKWRVCVLYYFQVCVQIIRGVSKKFGEWYQKTNKTEDTNKLTLLAFKIIAILHNTLLATFINLLETVSKGLCRNRSQNRCHMFLDCRHVCKTCTFHDALQAGKQKEVRRHQIRIHPFCEQSSQGMRPGATSSIGIQVAIDGMAFTIFNATQKESLAKVKTM